MPRSLPASCACLPPPSADERRFALHAYRALLSEVNLTPKPGLVDRDNNGAHRDMHIGHFYRSARAIGVWLPRFIRQGRQDAALPADRVLARLRPLGLACENQMFRATGGVNTHKGSVFALGLLCCAFGRLPSSGRTPAALCAEVAAICRGLTARELRRNNAGQTAGQRLYRRYGLGGARGEAEAGFPLVLHGALPRYLRRLRQGDDAQSALQDCLLWLMAHNDDTNVAARGGMEGLRWLQQRASQLLAQGGAGGSEGNARLRRFDAECIARHLSPGGSADLLMVTWLLAQMPPAASQE
ncbi:triphosphoribosyl-dephospho-CoA synthase CitG [Serratia sp. FGI94]|uniref:triphosphoribosyl-dephospho-CoA synthase CitG n=1 Tax=Serratia sp. FGI94 TaxID=671990 RepID=UPI0002A73A44|nr:triphosphoribosyl-dephospho-CoA synthase CitG [Serratia sp. FGI94]AGB83159.1 triphosphoribosyl-dephospho-CoA synthase CitG [Serratia sp. FGI94]